MHWRRKKITYDILIPELGKSIFQLNKEEAGAYFRWYMEKVPERVSYVSRVCAKELHISVEKLDCSPESLLLLWKWFRRRARTEHVRPTKEEKQHKKWPNHVLTNTRQMSLETEYIIRDIGMYLGETFRKNMPQIYWTYYTKPKRDFFQNHPLLKGFIDRSFGHPCEVCFEPIHMTRVQASRLLDRTSKNADLFDLYHLWAEKV